jgi:hypothetical protein
MDFVRKSSVVLEISAECQNLLLRLAINLTVAA